MSDVERIFSAFPETLHKEVEKVIEVLPWSNHQLLWRGQIQAIDDLIHSEYIVVTLDNEPIYIPGRVYFNEPLHEQEHSLTDVQKSILNCIYLRHCDGFVRQKRLERLLNDRNYFITPFLFCLLGEYVIEILDVLDQHISPDTIHNYVRFIMENRTFWQKTESRMTSYWNEYYRARYPKISNYIGRKIATKLQIEVSKRFNTAQQ